MIHRYQVKVSREESFNVLEDLFQYQMKDHIICRIIEPTYDNGIFQFGLTEKLGKTGTKKLKKFDLRKVNDVFSEN